MLETRAVQDAQGNAVRGVKEQRDTKETREQGMTHFSITQTWEPSLGATAEKLPCTGEDQPG